MRLRRGRGGSGASGERGGGEGEVLSRFVASPRSGPSRFRSGLARWSWGMVTELSTLIPSAAWGFV